VRTVASSLIRVFLVAILSVTFVYAHLAGPPPGHTGAPGEGTCADAGCHDSYATDSGPGILYVPPLRGCSDTVRVRVGAESGSELRQFGFQVTAVDFFTGEQVGELSLIDSQRTRLDVDSLGRTFVSQTAASANDTTSNSVSWDLAWIGNSGSPSWVTFHVSGIVGNADGTGSGDFVYTDNTPEFLPPLSIEVAGDVNVDGVITTADLIVLINFLFKGGPPPEPCETNGDVNCTGRTTSADLIYMIGHIFKGQQPPCDICNNPGAEPCF
jgi:hypothetical protein